jgi:hypothetical protein
MGVKCGTICDEAKVRAAFDCLQDWEASGCAAQLSGLQLKLCPAGLLLKWGHSRLSPISRRGCISACIVHCQVKAMLADSPALLQKFLSSLLDSYVEDNSRVKWCPSVPHCGLAIQALPAPH